MGNKLQFKATAPRHRSNTAKKQVCRISESIGSLMLFLLACVLSGSKALAQDEPVITFDLKSDSVYFYIQAVDETTTLSVDFGDGQPLPFTIRPEEQTVIRGIIGEQKKVKVYGKADQILSFYCENYGLTSLDLSKCQKLIYLACPNNLLTALDVTQNKELLYLLAYGNNINSLDLSANEQLLSLDIHYNSAIGTVDVSHCKQLTELIAMDCSQMYSLDISQNTELKRLSVSGTSLSSVDLSHNAQLQILDVGYSRISSLDISKNTALRELYFSNRTDSYYRFTSIDVSNQPELAILFGSGNRIPEIDLSHNPKLRSFFFADNELTELDLSNNPEIIELNLSQNRLNYSSLPVPGDQYQLYWFSPQKPVLVKQEVATGEALDLSREMYDADHEMKFDVIAVNEDDPSKNYVLTENTDYTWNAGKLTFLKAQKDSVYFQALHELYDGLFLQTQKMCIKDPADIGKPDEVLRFTTDVETGNNLSFELTSNIPDAKIYIDYGDHELKEYTIQTYINPYGGRISGTVAGEGEVIVYADQGVYLTNLQLSNNLITSINLSKSRNIHTLNLGYNQLDSIDISKNKRLQNIDVSNNRIAELNLSGHNNLINLECSGNQMKSLVLTNCTSVKYLRANNNQLSAINLQNQTALEELELYNNRLTSINLVYLNQLKTLKISNNYLTTLDLQWNPELNVLWADTNCFKYSTMPQSTATNVFLAGQRPINIPAIANSVDLSSEYDINGSITTFTWKTKEGMRLLEGEDYTIDHGKTTFLNFDLDSVYCELTNEDFPDFTDYKVLKTTCIKPAEKANWLIADITAKDNPGVETEIALRASKAGYVYLDFGDGNQEEVYIGTELVRRKGTLKEGKYIKVYTYGDNDTQIDLFSISDLLIAEADISKLAGLKALSIIRGRLKQIDLTHNPELEELNLEGNELTELDLSHNTQIRLMTLTNNKLEQLDITGLTALANLYAANNKLKELDLSQSAEMNQLYLDHNQLESIHLEACTKLHTLSCSFNALSELNVDGIESLRGVSCSNNNLSFSTLPLDVHDWYMYTYSPQNDLKIELVNGRIDLSAEYMIDYRETVYKWFTTSGKELIEGTDYTLENGITSFLKKQDEPVYCTLENTSFPKFTEDKQLKTEAVEITETVGIDETYAAVQVYAENGKIMVRIPGTADITVYSSNGQTECQLTAHASAEISGLPSGMHIIRINTTNKTYINKIVL